MRHSRVSRIQKERRRCARRIVTYFTRGVKRGVGKKKEKGKKEVLPAISTRILCSEQNIVRARDDNISGKWDGFIYISKIRKEAASIEIGGKKREPVFSWSLVGELLLDYFFPLFSIHHWIIFIALLTRSFKFANLYYCDKVTGVLVLN